jgi:hypothetical protein
MAIRALQQKKAALGGLLPQRFSLRVRCQNTVGAFADATAANARTGVAGLAYNQATKTIAATNAVTFHVLDFVKIFLLVANLVWIAQQRTHQAFIQGL